MNGGKCIILKRRKIAINNLKLHGKGERSRKSSLSTNTSSPGNKSHQPKDRDMRMCTTSPFLRPSGSREGGVRPTFNNLLTSYKLSIVPETYRGQIDGQTVGHSYKVSDWWTVSDAGRHTTSISEDIQRKRSSDWCGNNDTKEWLAWMAPKLMLGGEGGMAVTVGEYRDFMDHQSSPQDL